MQWIATELFTALLNLLPGFLTAWVVNGLVPRYKLTPFERVIEALIFTAIIQVPTIAVRESFYWIGRTVPLGAWTEDSRLVCSYILAVVLGLTVAYVSNNDALHRLLRRLDFTRITSYPSQWFGVFAQRQQYVTLYLRDGRRVFGWPRDWPDFPDEGEFSLVSVEWLERADDDTNRRISLGSEEAVLLVHAQDVQFVEFLPFPDELQAPNETGKMSSGGQSK